MRVGQLQILTGDEIRDGQKLRTPLNPGAERERDFSNCHGTRTESRSCERDTFAGVGLGIWLAKPSAGGDPGTITQRYS